MNTTKRLDIRGGLSIFPPELAAVLGAERFVQEIKTTASLQHPHILPLFDSGEADTFLYYVMPYVEGETLRDRLQRETQLPIDDAVQKAIAKLPADRFTTAADFSRAIGDSSFTTQASVVAPLPTEHNPGSRLRSRPPRWRLSLPLQRS
jgi:serine/threonine protein kinase